MTDSPVTPSLPSLEDAFATLSELGAALNQGTDSLNHILQGAEKRLDQLNLHVEAEVKLPPSSADEKDSYFGYGQRVLNRTSGWGLYHRAEGEPCGRSVFDCSRDVRIRVVALLPKLLKAVEARTRKLLSEIEEAKKAQAG